MFSCRNNLLLEPGSVCVRAWVWVCAHVCLGVFRAGISSIKTKMPTALKMYWRKWVVETNWQRKTYQRFQIYSVLDIVGWRQNESQLISTNTSSYSLCAQQAARQKPKSCRKLQGCPRKKQNKEQNKKPKQPRENNHFYRQDSFTNCLNKVVVVYAKPYTERIRRFPLILPVTKAWLPGCLFADEGGWQQQLDPSIVSLTCSGTNRVQGVWPLAPSTEAAGDSPSQDTHNPAKDTLNVDFASPFQRPFPALLPLHPLSRISDQQKTVQGNSTLTVCCQHHCFKSKGSNTKRRQPSSFHKFRIPSKPISHLCKYNTR